MQWAITLHRTIFSLLICVHKIETRDIENILKLNIYFVK